MSSLPALVAIAQGHSKIGVGDRVEPGWLAAERATPRSPRRSRPGRDNFNAIDPNVVNTGGSPAAGQTYGIYAEGDVIDNVVDGVYGADSLVNFGANGIYSPADAGVNLGIVIQGNRIRNLTPKGTGQAIGITSNGSGVAVRDNAIGQAALTTGFGISCADNTSHVRDNVTLKYATGIAVACHDAGGNSN